MEFTKSADCRSICRKIAVGNCRVCRLQTTEQDLLQDNGRDALFHIVYPSEMRYSPVAVGLFLLESTLLRNYVVLDRNTLTERVVL
jgi:hypothetical protein